jgi:lipopolysaccharide kinase (Kdo/WaaP) family protein
MSVREGSAKDDPLIPGKTGSWHYLVANALAAIDASASAELNIPFSNSFTELLPIQSSKATSVYWANIVTPNHSIPIFIKQFHFRSLADRCKHLLRKSRAMRAVTADAMLIQQGFIAPKTLIVGWQKNYCIKDKFFTVTRALVKYKDIYEQISTISDQGREAKRAFLIALAREIAALHGAKISHGDMRAGNILSKHNDTWQFAYIDNERTRKHLHLPTKIRVKNLVQLNLLLSPAISRTDRLCFFQTYCECCFGSFNKKLLTRVLAKTRQRMARLLSTHRIQQSDIWY